MLPRCNMAKAKSVGGATITKADAVRAALADGIDAPAEIVSYAKEKHGLDITPGQASTYKSLEKKRSTSSHGRKVGRRQVKSGSGGTIDDNGLVAVKDLEAVKSLVEKVGAERVKRIAGLFE
jgi:hypothetical protein